CRLLHLRGEVSPLSPRIPKAQSAAQPRGERLLEVTPDRLGQLSPQPGQQEGGVMTDRPFTDWAVHLVDLGYSPVPLRAGEKRPLEDGWDRVRRTPMTVAEIEALVHKYPGLGLGVAGGYNGLVPVDVDTDDKTIRAAIRSALPEPLVVKRGAVGAT